ncbi:immunity 26/phosphotriesterase HocA family protein [Maricaulis sp.]|uniref:immunity 26/phosphotriesterase HocA family protein n=1 Tax=Maricaulis sp. TaxID=1486257 RepID=UPI00262FC0FE|nr:immunity 26/phosphotriesterase HocA family protein [Maricaulis sp.]
MRKKTGDVVEFSLPDGGFAYAKILKSPLVAFYDCITAERVPLADVTSAKTAFSVWVMDEAVNSKAWKKIGTTALTEDDLRERLFFSRDMISKDYVLHDDFGTAPASKEDCIGLEVAAIWSKKQIEERLSHHRRGESSPILRRHQEMLSEHWDFPSRK